MDEDSTSRLRWPAVASPRPSVRSFFSRLSRPSLLSVLREGQPKGHCTLVPDPMSVPLHSFLSVVSLFFSHTPRLFLSAAPAFAHCGQPAGDSHKAGPLSFDLFFILAHS